MSENGPDPDDLRERLEALAERLEAASTEDEYGEIEAAIDELEADVDAVDDEEPAEELAEGLDELAETLEAERGPYAEDVVAALEGARDAIRSEEWTEAGEAEVLEAVAALGEGDDDLLEPASPDSLEAAAEAVDDAVAAVEDAGLDPDADAEAIAALLAAAEGLADAVDAAETWDDLSVRGKLEVSGFYDVLDHRKDYPPEWSALKAHEQAGNVDQILLAFELLDSAFMQEHCLEALKRLGPPEALEPMMELAQRRDRDAIEVLGRIGDDEPVEMLVGFVEEGPNRPLELTLLQTLGRIGDPAATQTVANRLAAEDPLVRSVAARSLGMLGDPRAIDPLADVLAEDDAGNVRGSAAWALNEIGTRRALEAVEAHAGDREYLVEVQADRARAALGADEGTA